MFATNLYLTHAVSVRISNTRLHQALQHLSARLWTELRPRRKTDERSSLSHTITYGHRELNAAQECFHLRVQRRTTNDDLRELATKSFHQRLANLIQHQLVQQWHLQHPAHRFLRDLWLNHLLVDLLQYQWHRQDNRGLHFGEGLHQYLG